MSTADEKPVVYFAYGTLLGVDEMTSLCPGAVAVGHAELADHEFCFERFGPGPEQGGCSLRVVAGVKTIGVLYEIPQAQWAELRRAAGEPRDYSSLEVEVARGDAATTGAVTLTVTSPQGEFCPAPEYLAKIVDGARHAGLPSQYRVRLDDLVARARRRDGDSDH